MLDLSNYLCCSGWSSLSGYFEWGISPDREKYAYTNYKGTKVYNISHKYEERFYPVVFYDFAARIDWAQNGEGKRNPIVVVNREKGLGGITVRQRQGTSVTFDAAGTYDPDRDSITYSWLEVPEVDTYKNKLCYPVAVPTILLLISLPLPMLQVKVSL